MRMLKLEKCRNSELAVCRGRQLVADHVQMRAEMEASKPTGSRKFYVESGIITAE